MISNFILKSIVPRKDNAVQVSFNHNKILIKKREQQNTS